MNVDPLTMLCGMLALYLIPTPLGEEDFTKILSIGVQQPAGSAKKSRRYFCCTDSLKAIVVRSRERNEVILMELLFKQDGFYLG
ncbi:hypothetical protein ABO04_04690 [Nitrosomonas sp. HPC101]|nr:hypothetical protein [Nitrosomonas sp. HPC101]